MIVKNKIAFSAGIAIMLLGAWAKYRISLGDEVMIQLPKLPVIAMGAGAVISLCSLKSS